MGTTQSKMSKISSEHLRSCIGSMLEYSLKTKKRKFLETVELQIGLKNYDPSKDKRFKGSVILPNRAFKRKKICVLGNVNHCEEARAMGLDAMDVEKLKTFKKKKKLVKQLAGQYDAFLASSSLIKQIPRLLGPGLNKAGKFPGTIGDNDSMVEKVEELMSTVKFQLKSEMCLHTPIGNVGHTEDQLAQNINMAVNFLVSLLKKHWQNVRSVHIKSSMGPVQKLF